MVAVACIYLSDLYVSAGDLSRAERAARDALGAGAVPEATLAFAEATLARILLAKGERETGAASAAAALERLEREGAVDEGELRIRLAWAEALHADGQLERARGYVRDLHDRLELEAATLGDAAAERAYLERVPEHADVRTLVTSWCGRDDTSSRDIPRGSD
jgi:hypothetical protein